MSDIWKEIQAERESQKKKGYDQKHDAEHCITDWTSHLHEYTYRIIAYYNSGGWLATRKSLLKVAAIAVAGIEAIDKRISG